MPNFYPKMAIMKISASFPHGMDAPDCTYEPRSREIF